MHIGHYVFYQITNRFKRQFNRIVSRYDDRTKDWSFTHWNHLCVLIFAQLSGCASLRELVDIIQAHAKRSYNLGFGATTPNRRSVISKSNTLRDYRIYEEFACYMVGQAQKRRITREFELHGRFYAVDSTTIDLCLSVFRWAEFRSKKGGIFDLSRLFAVEQAGAFFIIREGTSIFHFLPSPPTLMQSP